MSIYFTKCGREFNKSSTATVTGYRMADDDVRCHGDGAGQAPCPFRVEVTENWPPVHKCWECRAGSKPPNHTTEWTGSLTDKNSIQIHSLDVALMEEIMSYCEAHPALGASYNADHLKDCRRTIAVCCSSNKKGIAAKNELIEKFFPEKKKGEKSCEESPTNTGSDSCVPGTQEDTATSTVDKPTAMTARDLSGTEAESCASCQANKESCQPYQACMSEGLEPEECVCNSWTEEGNEKEDQSDMGNGLCKLYGNDIDCWKRPDAPKLCVKEDEITCHYFLENEQKTAENNSFLPENVSKTDEIVSFDYSIVDEETGAFLMEKANNITFINAGTSCAIGRELKEAQAKLANNRNGVFQSWCRSLNISDDTAYNYIHVYDFITERFGDIGSAKDFISLPQRLQYAVSKPSARPELQQAVLAGDIKTHKEYKELEQKLRDAEERARKAYEAKNKAEMDFDKLSSESASHIKSNIQKIQDLKQQLDQANHNYNQTKVEEMEQAIAEKEDEIDELRRQLKDKPIEATATRVVEKLPDDVQEYLSSVYDTMRHMQNFAKVNQVLNLIVGLSTDELQSWAAMMNNRRAVNDDDESETLELLAMAIQSLQDMMDDYESGRCE